MIERIVIFGATGDLTARFLIPALAKLHEVGKLPDEIKITGVDRREWENGKNGFEHHILDGLERFAGSVTAESRARFVEEVLEYRRADVTDAESVVEALGSLSEPVVAYLALPPAVFAPTIEVLKRANLPISTSSDQEQQD